MTRYTVVVLLFGAMAIGQSTQSSPAAQQPASSQSTSASATVGPDTPVITINGMCDHPSANEPAANCKKVITRAQFELMVEAAQPNLPVSARREFANRYVSALVTAQKAHEMKLEEGPNYEAHMRIARAQVLAQELNLAVYVNSLQISDNQIENFYQKNISLYVEADLTRIIMPRMMQLSATKEKLSADEELKRTQESEKIMKAEADKLHARAVAGENFDDLEKEVFEFAKGQGSPPNTKIGKLRGDRLPPSQLSVMDLKTGEVSPVLSDQNGYYIYKVGEKRTLPIDEVREDIRKTLGDQRRQTEMNAIIDSATSTLDETYFGK